MFQMAPLTSRLPRYSARPEGNSRLTLEKNTGHAKIDDRVVGVGSAEQNIVLPLPLA
jgi:hypothetical protein